jgi:alpha-1,3-rhamnosyltransferase
MELESIQTCANPLVSIIVITYNSAKFVLETLESIKAQTYQNIEIIVSDDCSKDETVEICRKWIEENQYRFVRAELITIEKNTGIPANCNRGIQISNGEWIKLIAGDDELLQNCIEINISFILNNPNINFLQTNANFFADTISPNWFLRSSTDEKIPFYRKGITAKEQHKMILKRNQIIAPAIFLRREAFFKLNGYDESMSLIEDLPFWCKATSLGYKIDFYEPITINYRLRKKSIPVNGKVMSTKYAKDLLIYSEKYKKYNVNAVHYACYNLGLYLIIGFNKIGLSKFDSKIVKIFNYFISKLMQIGI